MDTTTIESINSSPIPNTKKKLQLFIGIVRDLSPFYH